MELLQTKHLQTVAQQRTSMMIQCNSQAEQAFIRLKKASWDHLALKLINYNSPLASTLTRPSMPLEEIYSQRMSNIARDQWNTFLESSQQVT